MLSSLGSIHIALCIQLFTSVTAPSGHAAPPINLPVKSVDFDVFTNTPGTLEGASQYVNHELRFFVGPGYPVGVSDLVTPVQRMSWARDADPRTRELLQGLFDLEYAPPTIEAYRATIARRLREIQKQIQAGSLRDPNFEDTEEYSDLLNQQGDYAMKAQNPEYLGVEIGFYTLRDLSTNEVVAHSPYFSNYEHAVVEGDLIERELQRFLLAQGQRLRSGRFALEFHHNHPSQPGLNPLSAGDARMSEREIQILRSMRLGSIVEYRSHAIQSIPSIGIGPHRVGTAVLYQAVTPILH